MTNIKQTNNWKLVVSTLVILLTGICVTTGYASTEVRNDKCVTNNNSNGQDVIRRADDKTGKQESQMRESNLLKDAVMQSADKGSVREESGLNEGKSLLLADGSTSDEPLLQKFIKKLGSIIWG